MAQLDAPSDWRPGGHEFNPNRGWQHSFVEIDHEITSTVIFSLLQIQEGQLSVSGERKCMHFRRCIINFSLCDLFMNNETNPINTFIKSIQDFHCHK